MRPCRATTVGSAPWVMTTVRGRTPLALPNRDICVSKGARRLRSDAASAGGSPRHSRRCLCVAESPCRLCPTRRGVRNAARQGRLAAPARRPTRSAMSSTSSVSHPSLLANARASFSAAHSARWRQVATHECSVHGRAPASSLLSRQPRSCLGRAWAARSRRGMRARQGRTPGWAAAPLPGAQSLVKAKTAQIEC